TYVLWNAGPAYYAKVGFCPARVHPVIRGRAQRYVNLRTVDLVAGPAAKPASVTPVKPPQPPAAPQAASVPAWTLEQAITISAPALNTFALAPSVPGLPASSILPRSVFGEHN